MKILAIDTSAGPASCAVVEEGEILASSVIYTKLTHSQTVLPMVQDLLRNAGLSWETIEVLAVSAGPGSFTGVRIGVAAVKGMAFSRNLPCAAVSTLAAMAQNVVDFPFDGVVCGAMDARCQQVYTALFSSAGGNIERMTPDEAISLEELKNRLISLKKPVLLVGDGAKLCYNTFQEEVSDLWLAPAAIRNQQATGVAAQAAVMAREGKLCSHDQLQPVYLRLPQAERELRQRQAANIQQTQN